MGYFRKNIDGLEAYQPGFQPSRTDVIKLNTNENPYPPSPKVMEAISGIGPEQIRKYPDPLGGQFRRAAAEAIGVIPENIMCCNGADEMLTLAFRAFCDAKRPVAYPVPSYTLYPVLAKLQNCKAIEVPFDEEYNLPSRLASAGAALTIVCNPNAPTGTFVSVDEVASLADEITGVLLIDEAYVDFAEDNCVRLVDGLNNVIILRSMSKGYSLAGLRFGYAVAQEELIKGLLKIKDSYNVDAVATAAAAAAIEDRKYFAENIEKIKKERKRLTDELRKIGFVVPDSFANFVLVGINEYKASVIYDKLVQQDIYVRFFNLPGVDNKLRITVGTPQQNDRLIDALKQIFSE